MTSETVVVDFNPQTLPLRQDLEHEFKTIYRKVATQLQGMEETAKSQIFNEVGNFLPMNKLVVEGASIYMIDPEPSISSLGQTVAIELDDLTNGRLEELYVPHAVAGIR